MKNIIICLSAAAVCLMTSNVYSGEDERSFPIVRLTGDYWYSSIGVDVEYEGDEFSLEDDLSMSPRKDIPVLELELRWNETSAVFFSHFAPSYRGTDSIRRDIEYGGVKFPADVDIEYDFDISYTDILYRGRLSNSSRIRLDILFGAKIADLALELVGREAETGEEKTVREDVTAPVPVVGLWVSGDITDKLGFEVQGRGLTLPIEGYRFDMLDANAMVGYDVHENFHIGAGYRIFLIKGEADDFKVNSTMTGFVLRGMLRY